MTPMMDPDTPSDSQRPRLQAEWSAWRAPTEYEGEPTHYAALIEKRQRVVPSEMPVTGVIGNWTLRKDVADTVAVISGQCLTDNAGRGFENGPIRTSLIVKIEDGFAVTLNSVYRLLSDDDTALVMAGGMKL